MGGELRMRLECSIFTNRSCFTIYECIFGIVVSSSCTEQLPETADVKSSEKQQSETEAKPALMDTDEMQQKFTGLIDKVQLLLATPDADPTEPVSTSKSATDISVNECKAYLDLIEFDTESISDLQSLFKLLIPYINFRRFHILEAIVGQFKSAKAKQEMQKYRALLNAYQSSVDLGRFVHAIKRQTAPENPAFMRHFSLQLESKWATCAIEDLENLLVQILPKSIGYTFVWFCNAHQFLNDNSIRLDYIVPPFMVENLRNVAERKKGILRSAGVLSICIDGTYIEPKVGWFYVSYVLRLVWQKNGTWYPLPLLFQLKVHSMFES